MRAIQVTAWGQSPAFTDSAATPPLPPADSNEVQVKIIAAGLHQLVRSQAAGKHYSTNPATTPTPYIPGADGVGTLPDGQLVYFSNISKGGAFAEYTTLPKQAIVPIPIDPSSSDETKRTLAIRIATLFNPAMSSYMALQTRLSASLEPGSFTALILGATSLSGQIAIKTLRRMGAKTIIGVARNATALSNLAIDISIPLQDPVSSTDFASVFSSHRPDVVLDYLYGEPALHLFASLPSDARSAHDLGTEYIQIGSMAGLDISLPGALLRSKNLTLRGAGPGSWSVTKDAAKGFPGLIKSLCDDEGFAIENFPGVKIRKLEDVKEAWDDGKGRTVFVN